LTKRNFHIPRIFWYAITLLIIYFVLNHLNIIPSIRNWFTSKKTTIDNTPVLIKEVKSIAQLMTMSSYDEVVVDSSKFANPAFPTAVITSAPKKSQLVIIAKGKLIAGIDLQELDDKKIYLNRDSVSITLPTVKILDAIVNPSQFEIFIEEKGWKADEVNNLKVSARNLMIQRATEQGLLLKAKEKAKLVMENFLRSLGFKKIDVK
jgi:hypothetical protein